MPDMSLMIHIIRQIDRRLCGFVITFISMVVICVEPYILNAASITRRYFRMEIYAII